MKPETRQNLAFLLVGSVLFLCSVLALLPAFGQEGSQTLPSSEKQRPVVAGDTAPAFTLKAEDGASYRLEDLRGQRNLVLIFFRGTW